MYAANGLFGKGNNNILRVIGCFYDGLYGMNTEWIINNITEF